MSLEALTFETTFPAPLDALGSPDWLASLLAASAPAALGRDEATREAVRDLLRQGGFKPTGRSKPASEYLLKAMNEGTLRTINAAVDACNAASLASGLPVSVVDLDRADPPFSIGLAAREASYVFNPSGQEIQLGGLVVLFDLQGPCGSPVKDSQRTKTSDATTRTLSVVWGTNRLPGRTARTVEWYREILGRLGATTRSVAIA